MADDFILGKTECIHFIYLNSTGKIVTGRANMIGVDISPGNSGGVYDVACLPGSARPKHATSEPEAVTCPKCKASEPFKKQVATNAAIAMGTSEADMAALQQAIERQATN